MNRLLKGLLALHLVFHGMPIAQARLPVSRSSPLPVQKITEDFLSYIHTTSPTIVIDLVDSQHVRSMGTYSFETYVVDLSQNRKRNLLDWAMENLRETRIFSPRADISVINVRDPSTFQLQKTKGRRPAAAKADPKLVGPTAILAADIAQLAGVRVQEKVVSSHNGSTGSVGSIPPTVIVLIEKVNNAPATWTLIELHGIGMAKSVALANTLGSLSGRFQFDGTALGNGSLQSTFINGYARLILQNQRRAQDFVSHRAIYVSAIPFLPPEILRNTRQQVRYLNTLSLQASVMQLPNIMSWISSLATEGFVSGLAESGPIVFVSSAANKGWEVALETSLQNQRRMTPEIEARIKTLELQRKMSIFWGEKFFGHLVGSNFGTSPEAWIIYSVAAATALTKIFYDYHKLVKALEREAQAEQQVATAAVTPPPPPARRTPIPMNCYQAFGRSGAINARVARL